MSWIVSKNKHLNKESIFDNFVLISTPKCGGMSLEKYLEENKFQLNRPEKPNLLGHYTFLDTYFKIKNSSFNSLNKYLIPYRNPYEWRKSWYKYIKTNPNGSGMPTLYNLFNNISFSDYVELLVSGEYKKFGTIENLPFIPRNNYITNMISKNIEINDVKIYLFDMSKGFKKLFQNHFYIDIDEINKINTTSDVDDYTLSDNLLEKLNLFDTLETSNQNVYINLN